MLPVYKWKIQRKNEEGGKIGKFLKSSVFKELKKKKKRKKKKHPIWSPNDSGTAEYWVVFLFYMKDGKIKIDLARFCS